MPYENFDWITDRLAVGGLVSDPEDLPFDAILSMAPDAPLTVGDLVRSGNVDYRWYSIIDGYSWEGHDEIVRRFDAAAAQIHQWLSEGKRVLVHCHAGVSRSATAAVWYLVRYEGLTWEEAFNKVRAARPGVFPNPRFEIALRVSSGELIDWNTFDQRIAEHCVRLQDFNLSDSRREILEDLERQGTLALIKRSA
jgi:hypothetical protein